MKVTATIAVAAALLAATVGSVQADVTLMSDPLTGSGALASSSPTVGTGHWSAYYSNNGAELVPSYQSDSTGSGFPSPATTGTLPVYPARSASGVNVGAYTSHTDDGAYIAITPASSGLLTANGTFTFPNIAATGNPTAWAFIGLTTSLSSPDVISNAGSIGPWLLVRPASNGTDVVELYATGGTTNQAGTTNTEVGTTGPHTMSIFFDPVAGTLNASVDGANILTTAYSYSGHSVTIPTVNGFIMGDRTNTGLASTTSPSTAFLTNVSVTQVPEPASIGLLGLAATSLIARRRR
ncbi:MAG TPA: PEP-CTERM sorting domain-containing protein [Phycisphaerae bacterium]|nr:PEP-CTERM sorting domain-containing protein [Phycisphaerae bacterium]